MEDSTVEDVLSSSPFANSQPQHSLLSAPSPAFSAVTLSMLPIDTLQDSTSTMAVDAFGFFIDLDQQQEDEARGSSESRKTLECLLKPSELQLSSWRVFLSTYYSSNHSCDICDTCNSKSDGETQRWCQVTPCDTLDELLTEDGGMPHSLRPYLWPRFCGVYEKQCHLGHLTYESIVREADLDTLPYVKDIEKDLLRTLPSNACFCQPSSPGVPRLRRILRSLAWLYPNIRYCQGMGSIVATLLLVVEEEAAFWLSRSIIEDLLPPAYFTVDLQGVHADQRVLHDLLAVCLPRVAELLIEHSIELAPLSLGWFLTLFASVIPTPVLLRIWDLFFLHKSIVLFQVALAVLKFKEKDLLQMSTSTDILTCLSNMDELLLNVDVDHFLRVARSMSQHFSRDTVTALRASHSRHLAVLLAELHNDTKPNESRNSPHLASFTQHRIQRSKSLFTFLWNPAGPLETSTSSKPEAMPHSVSTASMNHEEDQSLRTKNIRQTEMLLRLHHAIRDLVQHFYVHDPQLRRILSQGNIGAGGDHLMEAGEDETASSVFMHHHEGVCGETLHDLDVPFSVDYSVESHARDLDNYARVAIHKRRRAKALVDFERQEDDELGFRKHDVITVLSCRDEHCWVGELNGMRGWFPSKFVQLLDERSKFYSAAGDESVDPDISSLVREGLCPALQRILEHGLKRGASLLEWHRHPWHFVEEASLSQAQQQQHHANSRLVLCNTFKLEEDGKVLTPEELLYKAVRSINSTHNAAHATPDVKFRSFVCWGLNEQVLHLWLEAMCSSVESVRRWYHPWSFMRSPAWVQIKCQLRVLSQFGFHLTPNAELSNSQNGQKTIRHGTEDGESSGETGLDATGGTEIRQSIHDLLIRHHLFSWEL